MDVNALHSCFESTLDADINKRRHAELQLREAEQTPGFINGCLDIVLEPQVAPPIKVAAAIYLKNKVVRFWSPLDDNSPYKIDESEKKPFRERLLPALGKVPPHIRSVLVSALGTIINKDYPENWPELIDITVKLFQSNDIESVSTGATCLLEICRHYRWMTGDSRKDFDHVIDAVFPGVLSMANSLVGETSQQAASILRDIIKAYKMATYHVFPVALQQHDSHVAWGSLFLNVIKKNLPDDVLTGDEDERELHPWVKCKKWSLANLYRLFVRYANPVSRTDNNYSQFASDFVANMVPEILKTYFEQVQLWVDNKVWLGKACMFHILSFFEHSINIKASWEIVKPHVNTLVSHVIFPLLCPTDEDLEQFEDEPHEYINKHIDMIDDTLTPDIAATNFLLVLMKKKRKIVFTPLLQFVQSVVARHLENQEDMEFCRQKEGALRMMGSLSYIVLSKKSPIADNMENFLVQYVFPDFSNSHGFLRARACEFLNAYAETKFSNVENVSFAYQSVLKCMNDEHLPVQVEAALALQPLISHDAVRAALSPRIPEIMQHLLDLGNKVDIDAISGIMEEFVEVFAEQISPFAVQLAEQLKDQFMRITGEMLEKQNISPEDLSLDDLSTDDKAMAGLGILNTLTSLLLALDNSTELVEQLEPVLLPIFVTILSKDVSEFYTEIFGLIENFTFALKRISPNMWEVYNLLYHAFQGAGCDYLDDMLPCLENFIQYGAQDMASNPELPKCVFDIVQNVMTDEDRLGATDRTIAASLSQLMLLSLKGTIDQYVPELLNFSVERIHKDAKRLNNIAYCVGLLEIVIAGLNYNAHATLQFLESKQYTADFFTLWFNKMNHFQRVYDKKLCALAILSIISLPQDSIPVSLQSNLPQLSSGLITIMASIPEAIAKKEALAKEFETADFYDNYADNDDDDDNEWGDEDNFEDVGDGIEVSAGSAEYQDFLEKQTQKLQEGYGYFDDDDEELEEEPLIDNILDQVNVDSIFRDTFASLSQNDAAKYQLVTSAFSESDHKIMQETIARRESCRTDPQLRQHGGPPAIMESITALEAIKAEFISLSGPVSNVTLTPYNKRPSVGTVLSASALPVKGRASKRG